MGTDNRELTPFIISASKACLDLLNDDITDDELPEEGWRILGRFVVDAAEEPARQGNPRWKVWRRS